MEPKVSYFYRKISGKKKSPVCVSVRFNNKTLAYVTGIELNKQEYDDSQKKNPEGQALSHFVQMKTAQARMEAIALIMEPYTPKFFAYIVKKAAKVCTDIFTNRDRDFDAHAIASHYLEEFKKSCPGATIPILLVSSNDRALAPLNAYAQNVQASLIPSVHKNPAVLHSKPFTPDNKAILMDGSKMANENGGSTQILIQNTYVIHGNGVGVNGQIALPESHSKYNPDSNLLTWIINSMDKRNKIATDTGYKSAVLKLTTYARKKELLTSVDGEDHLAFKSVDKNFFENFEKWLLREGITLKDDTKKGMKRNGVRTYMAYIKSALAAAVEEGIILQKENPFGKQKYIVLKGEKQDRSLTPEEFEAILTYKASRKIIKYKDRRGVSEAEMQAIIELMYCLSGINLADLAKMCCYQIKNFHLSFIRQKMVRKKGLGEVDLEIIPYVQELFAEWGTPIDKKTGCIKAKQPDDFVFPILSPVFPPKKMEEMTEEEKEAWDKEKHKEYKTQIDTYGIRINRFLEKILISAGFDPTGITMYSIRHTFVNDARKAGMEVDKVMKRLGQSSYEAFSHYNNRLEQEAEDKVNGMIEKFKKAS